MFPTIPDDRSKLTAQELRSLAREIRKVAREQLDAARGTDEFGAKIAELTTWNETQKALDSEADVLDAEAALETDLGDDEGDEEESDDEEETEEEETKEEAETTAAAPTRSRPRLGVPARQETIVPAAGVTVLDKIVARDGISGKRQGDQFDNWLELATSLQDTAKLISPESDKRHYVAYAPARIDPERVLTDDVNFNLRLFDTELTAAMCAPAEPRYDLACANTARRPVKASLPGFDAPRGAVTIYPSPTLEDITTGVGIWTAADDANVNATKETCARIVCATPVEYRIYGVYRCITIKNMLQLTFPELVEAYLNRLSAAWAREAETALLEAMGSASDSVVYAETPGYNGTTSVLRSILQYLNAYQELQRWDNPEMEVWMHRGIRSAMKADLISRRNTSGTVLQVPSDAAIDALFRDAGVTAHWFLDRPSWMTPIPQFTASVAGVGNRARDFPRNVEMLVAPRGKYAVMDRGELNIGVTGNGLYRDNTSNSKNEFTFFFENFEGVVDTDSCPSHILEINNVCWNGQQIADKVLDCEGQDQTGAGS